MARKIRFLLQGNVPSPSDAELRALHEAVSALPCGQYVLGREPNRGFGFFVSLALPSQLR